MVVSKYERAIGSHVLWFKEQIEKSKDGVIIVKLKDIKKEMGSEFVKLSDAGVYCRLKDVLLENGIKMVMKHLENKDKLLEMELAKEDEVLTSADAIYMRGNKVASKQGMTFSEYERKFDHKTYGSLPQEENTDCPLYFGQYIEKKYVSKIFEDPIPFEFPKDELGRITDKRKPYDYICKRRLKIKHAASCLRRKKSNNTEVAIGSVREYWGYLIRRNNIPDYWILSGWNDRESLEPMFVWIIRGHDEFLTQAMYDKGHKFWDRDSFTIYFNEKGIKKMKPYEVTDKLDKLKEVCSIAKMRC